MTDTTHADDTGTPILGAAVIFVRLLQVAAGLCAFILVAGALMGGMHAVAFVMIAIFAAVLLLVILVLEVVAVRGIRRWAA